MGPLPRLLSLARLESVFLPCPVRLRSNSLLPWYHHGEFSLVQPSIHYPYLLDTDKKQTCKPKSEANWSRPHLSMMMAITNPFTHYTINT